MRTIGTLALAALALVPAIMPLRRSRPDQKQFFDLYKELVETNTTVVDIGSCTQASHSRSRRG